MWIRYQDKDSERRGYQDAKGRIRIPAKFEWATAGSFYHIMALSEEDRPYSYYLLKNGRKAGVDSVYEFDNNFDCEREGKVLFRDKKSENEGFPLGCASTEQSK